MDSTKLTLWLVVPCSLSLFLACGGNTAIEPGAAQDPSGTSGQEAPPSEPGEAVDLLPCPGEGCPDLDDQAAEVIDRLNALQIATLAEWEAEVRSILLAAYDSDQSGALQTDGESDAVLCPVWRTVNRGYGERTNRGDSVRDAYGFAPATFWLGVLGVDRSQREHLRQMLLDCGVR